MYIPTWRKFYWSRGVSIELQTRENGLGCMVVEGRYIPESILQEKSQPARIHGVVSFPWRSFHDVPMNIQGWVYSMDWLKGESTGNNGCSMIFLWTMGVSSISFHENQSTDLCLWKLYFIGIRNIYKAIISNKMKYQAIGITTWNHPLLIWSPWGPHSDSPWFMMVYGCCDCGYIKSIYDSIII